MPKIIYIYEKSCNNKYIPNDTNITSETKE